MKTGDCPSFKPSLPLLMAAAQDSTAQEAVQLVTAIRLVGLSALGSPQVRDDAAFVRGQYCDVLVPSMDFVLERLEGAGFPPPYALYIAEALVCVHDDTADSSSVARAAFRLIYEKTDHLRTLPELNNHPQRDLLRKQIASIHKVCNDYMFTSAPTAGPARHLLDRSLLPESDVPDELIFIRVLQTHEIVFATAAVLGSRALQNIAHSRAADAVLDLDSMVRVESLFPALLRLLKPMSVDTWCSSIRPLVLQPSAIQSRHYHVLKGQLGGKDQTGEIARILTHPRFPAWEQQYVALCRALAAEARRLLQRWERMHLQIARKYTPGGSHGVSYLTAQIEGCEE
jgi:tryptophan 2,3-dioxygenase